jgi:hypothetical protein
LKGSSHKKAAFFPLATVAAALLAACQPTSFTTGTAGPPSSSTTSTPPQSLGPVPQEYQDTYDTLQSQLSAFASVPTGNAPGDTVIASALEAADGNTLSPGVLATNRIATATTMVHAMKAIGETGVTVQVSFPLLVSSFPDSSEYTTFYGDIAEVVHNEGMTLTVEENPLFGNISSIPISSYYAGLTLQSYAAADRQMAQTIIDVMQPTFLSILNEPDTYTAVIHQPGIDLNSAANGVQFVNMVMDGLQKNTTMVGAGTGTWTDPSYDQLLLAQTPVDFVDMHVYPIAQGDLTNMTEQVSASAAAHKPIVMTECWLYKQSTDGSPVDSVQAAPDEQAVETFSFWEPLDEQFLTTMVRYARSNGFLVVSPFSTENFFAYQTWTPALDAESPDQVRESFNQMVVVAMDSGQLSAVGETYAQVAS